MFVDLFSFQKLIKLFNFFWTRPGFARILLGFGCACCDLFFRSRKQWFSTSRTVKKSCRCHDLFSSKKVMGKIGLCDRFLESHGKIKLGFSFLKEKTW